MAYREQWFQSFVTTPLNRSVREFKLHNPAAILDKTRDIVIDEFDQSNQTVKDGMDISMAHIDFKNSVIKWAGANNPLWVIRDSFPDKIIEYKGDKQPIGVFEKANSFRQEEIAFEKGDQIFLFSDGYADQFGGPNGKKLKYKAFKKILLDNREKKMDQIKIELTSHFSEWKGDFEQLDDVCIIGIAF